VKERFLSVTVAVVRRRTALG